MTKVLVIEDEELIREYPEPSECKGFSAIGAGDGGVGLQLAKRLFLMIFCVMSGCQNLMGTRWSATSRLAHGNNSFHLSHCPDDRRCPSSRATPWRKRLSP